MADAPESPVVVQEIAEAEPVATNARRKAFQPKHSIIPEGDENAKPEQVAAATKIQAGARGRQARVHVQQAAACTVLLESL